MSNNTTGSRVTEVHPPTSGSVVLLAAALVAVGVGRLVLGESDERLRGAVEEEQLGEQLLLEVQLLHLAHRVDVEAQLQHLQHSPITK